MNKRGFGKLYQKNFDEKISVNEAIKEIECFLETISEAVIKDNKVKFMNRADPVTKEPKIIYPRKDVRFKLSENAKKSLWETR